MSTRRTRSARGGQRADGKIPRVSVIVPARNASATIGACLDALAAEGVPGEDAELIVVDDGSSDQTASLARRAGVRLIVGPGQGPAIARNLAAREARGELLLFLDADAAPRPGWLEEMIAPFADGQTVAVKGRYVTDQTALIARFAQLEFEEKYERLARAARVDFVDTGTAAYRRDAFIAAGGFDEAFPVPSAEDVDLGFRLAATGARLAFSPSAIVRHRHAESLATYLTKKARYGYFRVRVYRRYPEKALGDSYTPPTMALQIGLAGISGAAALVALPGWRPARWVLALALSVFGASTMPLTRRAIEHDASLAPLVPGLVFLRSFAQGLGLALGLVRALSEQREP